MAIYNGSVGILFTITISGLDISLSEGTLTIKVQRPDEQVDDWAVSIVDGPNGVCQHISADGELQEHGTYTIQGKWVPVAAPTNVLWTSQATFEVQQRIPT